MHVHIIWTTCNLSVLLYFHIWSYKLEIWRARTQFVLQISIIITELLVKWSQYPSQQFGLGTFSCCSETLGWVYRFFDEICDSINSSCWEGVGNLWYCYSHSVYHFTTIMYLYNTLHVHIYCMARNFGKYWIWRISLQNVMANFHKMLIVSAQVCAHRHKFFNLTIVRKIARLKTSPEFPAIQVHLFLRKD